MKRMFTVLSFVLVITAFAFAQSGEMMKKPADKSAAKKPAAAAKSDAEIQKCITDKFAAAEKLKSQGFSATVSNGEATIIGTANNAGSKGAATKIAKSCGATKVTNNISSPPVSKPAKPADKKPAEKKP
ncbi:MAG: BON domain-containing protein [Blastocatellia bacterium]